jgi:hypothetical protein
LAIGPWSVSSAPAAPQLDVSRLSVAPAPTESVAASAFSLVILTVYEPSGRHALTVPFGTP